jgi:hypothetical protein
MKIRVPKVSAAALLVIILSLSAAPSSYASRRDDSGPGDVRDRIVQFIRHIGHFFLPSGNSSDLSVPKP